VDVRLVSKTDTSFSFPQRMQPDFWITQFSFNWVRDEGEVGVSVGVNLPGCQANHTHRCSFKGMN
jgi:hypothetical protein